MQAECSKFHILDSHVLLLAPSAVNLNWTRMVLELTWSKTSKRVSGPSLALATLPDLPNELLFIIFHDLDNQTLFNLGLTCRRMNTVALNHFFSKNDIQDPGGGYFLPDPFNKPELPIQTIPALRSALFVHNLRNFDFVLNPRAKRMREEIADLYVLAARLYSINTFKLTWTTILFFLRRCKPSLRTTCGTGL